MVTMPSEAAHDPGLVSNCSGRHGRHAHQLRARRRRELEGDGAPTCARPNSRPAALRIQVDLAGPKLRTGALRELGQLLKLKPERDAFGRVLRPVRIELVGAETQPVGTSSRIGVSADIVRRAADGDRLRVRDARGKTRELPLTRRDAHTLVAELGNSLYLQGAP